ncbi:sporulene cyclase [Desulfotomaculum arcticum]|uniref:Sporulene cyclase n=1 Tax=Desulfotruncus arcticus DSM 17038 TaxID=1121424 RepID=A0A1I2WCM6_9FIRM|nr:squalene--hopene cyclase [Desulfotruncus arcticus]SFG98377.1 sporulene cyclase [Desulfotomaculum arcticum] [Desulfotruncus arcticus DSM 17038]
MALDNLQAQVNEKITGITAYLVNSQAADGSWCYCFESAISIDCYMIILLRHLNIRDNTLIYELAHRIRSRQDPSGAWKLFYDEPEGNLSATIECYYALLLTGYTSKDDPQMQKARDFILSKGGPHQAGSGTKAILALTGHYPWENTPEFPVEMILLPTWAPFNIYDFVSYNRVHLAPLMICRDKKFILPLTDGPDLSDLYPSTPAPQVDLPSFLLKAIKSGLKNIPLPTKEIHDLALSKLERFTLARTEIDGTLYSYFTSTFFMIFALLALGYESRHPVITKAVTGLRKMVCYTGVDYHQQETTSTIWDTALITYALQESGLVYNHPTINKATEFLLSKQQTGYGDWQVHNRQGHPGGWGFSRTNTINPDVDDTAYSLRALCRPAAHHPETMGAAWKAGLAWLLSMQNSDGGWPAFDKDTAKKWLDLLPLPDVKPVLTDPSAADLTGRAIEFLGNYAGLASSNHVRNGVEWLLQNQESDGSWYGRWGIAFIYGTWASVTGLVAAGVSPGHKAIQQGVKWLLSIQNPDGGWGESCLSDAERKYIPLGFSTPSQTAWAIDTLIAAGLRDNPAVTRGIEALLPLTANTGAASVYPTGAGLPGGAYIHYHSYRYVWPLVTFAHYLN